MQLSPESPVSLINGCGPATVKRLAAEGIVVCRDLEAYRGANTTILRIKAKMVKSTTTASTNSSTTNKVFINEPRRISDHTWHGRPVHIIRSKMGQLRVCRALVQDLVMMPDRGPMLEVRWMSTKGVRRKYVSPPLVLALHTLWWTDDVVSEGSEDDDEHKTDNVAGPLPLFNVSEDAIKKFTLNETKAVQAVVKETQQFKKVTP